MAEVKEVKTTDEADASKTTDDPKKYQADDSGNVTVPLSVLTGFKEDMHKYKEERNVLRKTVEDLTTKVDSFEDAKSEAENKKLLEDGEFKELSEKKEKEIESLKEDKKNLLIDSEIKVEALKSGASNVKDIIALFDKSKITVNDSGQIEGLADAMKEFSELKPYLFGGSKDDSNLDVDTKKAGKIPTDAKYEDLMKYPGQMVKMKKDNPELFKSLRDEYNKRNNIPTG